MIIIKRYGAPLVIACALYSLVYFIFGKETRYFGMGFFMSVLLSYLVRICDDIADYKKDRAEKKAPISEGVLVLMGASACAAILILAIISYAYLMFIPLVLILLQLLIKNKYRDIIKPLFMPGIIMTVVFSFFTPSLWLLVIVPILIISDVILIVFKRRRRNL